MGAIEDKVRRELDQAAERSPVFLEAAIGSRKQYGPEAALAAKIDHVLSVQGGQRKVLLMLAREIDQLREGR